MIETSEFRVSKSNDINLIRKLADDAISLFIEDGKKIEGVYDLLARGGASKAEHTFIPNWSDLDLSIIVEKVDSKVLNQIQMLYQKIKKIFSYKLSITVVSKKDFFSRFHHHGIKPIYYSKQLAASISLLRDKAPVNRIVNLKELKLDCLANISYLIHELRSRFLNLDDNELQSFLCHLLKRTKQFIRNSLFILAECENEEIDQDLFQEYFPNISSVFLIELKQYKINFNLYNSPTQIKELINKVFDILENIYAELILHLEGSPLIIENEQEYS